MGGPKAKTLHWTFHARAKMRHYRLSPQRVLRVLHSPKRAEEGVAPRTLAAMRPASVRLERTEAGKSSAASAKEVVQQEKWTQEIWVMVQDVGRKRKIISAWRYPGMSKVRSKLELDMFRGAYEDYLDAAAKKLASKDISRKKIDIGLGKWTGDRGPPRRAWQKRLPLASGQKPQKRAWPKRSLAKREPPAAIQI